MFILPTQEELENFKPDFTIYNACKTVDMSYVSHGFTLKFMLYLM